jgi:triosephosphate isomerase
MSQYNGTVKLLLQNKHKKCINSSEVRKAYGNDIAEEVSILYGGSVKPENAKEIF